MWNGKEGKERKKQSNMSTNRWLKIDRNWGLIGHPYNQRLHKFVWGKEEAKSKQFEKRAKRWGNWPRI